MLIVQSIAAQEIKIGGTLNVGLSQINSNLIFDGDHKNSFAVSGNIGGFFETKINTSSSVGLELLWIQIEGKESTNDKIIKNQNGDAIGKISDELRLHSSYLGIPFYYKVQLKKVGIKVGFQAMFFLFANSSYSAEGVIYNDPVDIKKEKEDIKFDKLDYGPKLGLSYQLNKVLTARLDYYHGLSNISNMDLPLERKNKQISLGIQYTFYSDAEEK